MQVTHEDLTRAEARSKHGAFTPLSKQLIGSFIVGLLFAGTLHEGMVLLLTPHSYPALLTLEIPQGTAQQVEAGEAMPTLPNRLALEVGGVLVIQNDDLVGHRVGPVQVPPGTTRRLTLDEANTYAYRCTCHPDHYISLDVRPRITFWQTLWSRLYVVSLSSPVIGLLFALYSLALFPPRLLPGLAVELTPATSHFIKESHAV